MLTWVKLLNMLTWVKSKRSVVLEARVPAPTELVPLISANDSQVTVLQFTILKPRKDQIFQQNINI